MRKPYRCIVCGKATNERIWVGGFTAKGNYKSDAICSDLCFTRACALFLPTEAGRANARAKLAELKKETVQ